MNYKYFTAATTFVFFMACISVLASPDDSVAVVEKNGRQVIVYEVGPKETMYSIARKYGVNPKAIVALNPEIDNGLKIGQKIFVPLIPRASLQSSPVPAYNEPSFEGKIVHTVEPKQTLFSISKRYNVSMENIKQWNNLTGNELKVGSNIIVGVSNSSAKSTSSEKSESVKQTTRSNSGNEKIVEKGLAEVFETTEGNIFHYALHRTVPTGDIIKVTNETNGNSVFVRVVGKMPSGTNSQTIIKTSKIAYERLGNTDGKPFKVEISYQP